jgi:hypothetical protein
LLRPRDEQAYSRPVARVLPSYVVGWLFTCAVAAAGPYVALFITQDAIWLYVGIIASLFFGLYAGVRDGRRLVFRRFQFVGLITAIGTATVMFLTILWTVSGVWEGTARWTTPLEWVTAELLPSIAAAVLGTWLFFVSGARLGTALQVWTGEKEQVGRKAPIQGSREGRSASTLGVKAQVWLGFAGTVLAGLISLFGTIFTVMATPGQ